MTFRGENSPWRIAMVIGLLLVATGLAPLAIAQDSEDETEPLEAQEEQDEPSGTEGKQPWPLYFEVAAGRADADDVNNSLQTLSTHVAHSTFTLEDQLYGRAAIGWKLPRGKGDFRLTWTGYKEDGYTMSSSGDLSSFDPTIPQSDQPSAVSDPVPFWAIELVDGQLSGHRFLPQWSPAQDTLEGTFADGFNTVRTISAGNGMLDCPQYALSLPAAPGTLIDGGPACEATFLVDRVTSRTMASDMQNRAQTVDLVYGREFGKERYTSHWWVGARYFIYEGNVPTPAWLARSLTGAGFTDGFALSMINMAQKTTGFGPNVAMTVYFNFFEKRLSLFLSGQAALVLYKSEIDSQQFFTEVQTDLPATYHLAARLSEDRDKTSWQNSIESGVRYNFRNGLQLELAYNYTGFLDAILLPSEIAIPISQNTTQGVSAIYNTQDYRLSAWRGGVAFQF